MNYAPLWCKSNFSFFEGASHPRELVEQARALVVRAIALLGHDGVHGIVRTHRAGPEEPVPALGKHRASCA